jgi:hypothetical protein
MKLKRTLKHCVKRFIDRASFASAGYFEYKTHIIQLSPDLINFEKPTKTPADENLLVFLDLLKVYRVKGMELTRVGGPNDGGYVTFLPSGPSTAVSLGVGPNVSWDQHMVAMGHHVEMFDPTISRPPQKVRGANFHRIGVEGNLEHNLNLDLRPLKSLREFCAPINRNLILKVDVEGAEWKAFANTTPSELQNYETILVEFHDLNQLMHHDKFDLIQLAISNICETHIPIHIHANNYSELKRYGNYWFPDAIEVSFFIKQKELKLELAKTIRSLHDSPNCAQLPDFNIEGITSAWS